MRRLILAYLVFCVFVLCADGLWAQTPASASLAFGAAPAASSLEESIAAFVAADREQAPPAGGILFVGSSSIRFWNDLEKQFGPRVVVKRGFGGSKMSDCTRYLDRLVLPHKPRLVLVYAGDNDLAEGISPSEILMSFQKFVEGIGRELPSTRIAYISIKPSPARARLMPRIQETNQLILKYTTENEVLDFIDVFTPMLDGDGRPRPELFRADALHLNDAGYTLWKAIIAQHVR
jgi:lysophospholipase L1-like esterase